MYKVLARKTT